MDHKTDIARFNLGPRLDTQSVPDNPWIAFMEVDAVNVLGVVDRDRPIALAFTESDRLQAAANTEHRQILITWALADMICRLCAAVVGAGLFVKFGDPQVQWSPEPAPPHSVAAKLEEEPFRWNEAYIPWLRDGERQQLFAFLLLQVNRFVLLHEAAHILHGHGARQTGEPPPWVVDGAQTSETDEQLAIASQARELVADAEAFHLHFSLLEAEFSGRPLDPMRELLRDKLAGTARDQLRLTLLAAFLVFQILDRRSWSIETARLSSHPPAPFRVRAIHATVLELGHAELSEQVLAEEVQFARYLGSAVVDIGLNRLPQLSWLESVAGPEFDQLFARIHREVPSWADRRRLRIG